MADRKLAASSNGMENASVESYEIVERRFEEQGSSSADELEGMWTDRGCGAALYEPGAESGKTRVMRARSCRINRVSDHNGFKTDEMRAYIANSCLGPGVVNAPLPLAFRAGEESFVAGQEAVEIHTTNWAAISVKEAALEEAQVGSAG
jgi:hypothetical protein